jgi:hypothetical protein
MDRVVGVEPTTSARLANLLSEVIAMERELGSNPTWSPLFLLCMVRSLLYTVKLSFKNIELIF